MKKLRVLCPQEYDGVTMVVATCTRCSVGWDRETQRCTVETGAEHLPAAQEVPNCPMSQQCQHQLQQVEPCTVRSKGLICESALEWSGVADPWDHPLGFSAITVATPEELKDMKR